MIREPAGWRGALRWLLRRFPLQDCLLCRGASAGQLLCGFCRRDLPRCAATLDRPALAVSCGLDALAVRFDYRVPLDSLLARFKYQGELALAPVLAGLLPPPPRPGGPGRAAAPPGTAVRPWLLAVPGDPLRLRQRGFDHLALLSAPYAARHGLTRLDAWRSAASGPQAGLGRRGRRTNLKGVFTVPSLRPGSAVLLLDDVLTTGATLGELALSCRAAGAGWVGAVVLARTPAARELRPDA